MLSFLHNKITGTWGQDTPVWYPYGRYPLWVKIKKKFFFPFFKHFASKYVQKDEQTPSGIFAGRVIHYKERR